MRRLITDRFDSPPSRREFLRRIGRTAAAALGAGTLPGIWSGCGSPLGTDGPGDGGQSALRLPEPVAPRGLLLRAAAGRADIGGGRIASAWMLNDELPSPFLRLGRGESVLISLRNQLAQDLALHWHGITPPAPMDGHPRSAVPPGATYEYRFTVTNRAGTYWYHPHTHMRTGEQVYRGMSGMFIVDDPAEDRFDLPAGEREIPLILQDRRVDGAGVPYYRPSGPDLMAGYMGPEAFANGVHNPFMEVDSASYRFRIVNGANARIFRIARSDGRPVTLIGNDGGLLPAPRVLPAVDLAPAERVDLLIDLRDASVGDRVVLRSLPFTIPGGMDSMGGANIQGEPLDLLELRVMRRTQDSAPIPGGFDVVPGPDPAKAVGERVFRFEAQMMDHRINGKSFEMERIDERVRFGDTEIWTLVNWTSFPHPVHLHGTQFRVVDRSGGRAQVLPWEEGLKDTVLVYPLETVRIAVCFDAHPGLFLLHCHNLEHEDMGMMANILIE